MISSPTVQRRLMVPRWRSLRLTTKSGELSSPIIPSKNDSRSIAVDVLRPLTRWRLQRDLISAAELVEAALVHGDESEAISAAQYLISGSTTAAPAVERQAVQLLLKLGRENDIPERLQVNGLLTPRQIRAQIASYPRDAIGWMELALVQTARGSINHGGRSVSVALQLAPNNRHILRSAARFFIHTNDPERAHSIISRAESTDHDPWLIASEIALARLADRRPNFYKRGLIILEDEQRLPREITELAGSITTNELIEGNKKKARRFFGRSMADPNGNALAQAEWASPSFGGELITPNQLLSVAEPFEARALHEFREGRFEAVLDECLLWAQSEPYSIRPYEHATSAAAVIERYDEAEEMAARGLRLRSNSATLLNGRAYALVALGRLEEAEQTLSKVAEDDNVQKLIKQANLGFIAISRKDLLSGVALYKNVIEGFKAAQSTTMAIYASTFLARALAKNDFFEEATILQEETKKALDLLPNQRPSKRVFQTTELILAARKHRHPS